MSGAPLPVLRADVIDFDAAWSLQRELAAARRETLILLQHAPVFTLGKNGDERNIIAPRGIPVRRIDRGGDVTYHGPGQLVGYPILDLRARRIGIKEHVARIERALVALLGGFGIAASAKPGCVGVWSARGKIASLGIRVADGMSMHGFALNLNNDLRPFSYINPCGVPSCAVTSMTEEAGRRIEVDEAADRMVPLFLHEYGIPSSSPCSPSLSCGF